MKRSNIVKIVICILCLYSQALFAQVQVPQVEKIIEFGDMELHLTEQARRDIQSSVDALYRSEKHFNIMLERVDLYLPLIEPIFEKYEVPDEFKYLVIQESALVPDAVSSSNAVGFWQFKEASATELDMRIDRQVDERMNIISATEGAAKYFLRSNAEFDNWLLSLQSYLTGQGGTSRSTDKRLYGARQMKIDGDTHWYVKKFLAYLVAFENAVGKQNRNLILYQYNNTGNKTLALIAREFDTNEEQLLNYNKWLKGSHIPDDKIYAVIIPLNIDESQDLLAENEKNKRENSAFGHKQQEPGKVPAPSKEQLAIIEFNNLKGVVAREGDNVMKLAELGDISEKKFRKFNDLEARDKIQAGQIYYLERKYRRARVYEHVYQPNESLWQISQQYGIRLDKLLQKNRIRNSSDAIKPGYVLWLRFMRPRYESVEYREVKAPKGNLYASTDKKVVAVPPAPAPAPALTPSEEARKVEQGPVSKKENKEEEKKEEQKKEEENKKENPAKAAPVKEDRAAPQQEKLLYPAEGPVAEPTKPKPKPAEENKIIQKDTSKVSTTESKVKEESEENARVNEKREDKEEAAQSTVFEEEESAADSFTVDGPVNFVDEEATEKPQQKKENLQQDLIHQVKAGETLYSLSRQYNVTVQEIIKWNKLPAQPILNIGQQLKVSPPKETNATPAQASSNPESAAEVEEEVPSAPEKNVKYHTVSAGESMYRVARMYNVTIKDIMQWNNKDNFDLREGEELIVGKPQE